MRVRSISAASSVTVLPCSAAIWQLHLSAALAYRDGHEAVATGIIEIADAAEQEWLRTKAAVG